MTPLDMKEYRKTTLKIDHLNRRARKLVLKIKEANALIMQTPEAHAQRKGIDKRSSTFAMKRMRWYMGALRILADDLAMEYHNLWCHAQGLTSRLSKQKETENKRWQKAAKKARANMPGAPR